MAVLVLVMGESGTGKTSSIRTFEKGEVSVFNIAKKPMPFKNVGDNALTILNVASYREVVGKLQIAKNKSLVIDDAQYLMGFEFFNSLEEKGYEKFTRLGGNFYHLIQTANALDYTKIVYFFMHSEKGEDGFEKAKTLGKLLEDKLTLEGLFTIVLKTVVRADSKGRQEYYFSTCNSGSDRVKSPFGMFDTPLIPNDLKLVDKTIREYYELAPNDAMGKTKDNKAMQKEEVEGIK